MRISRSLYATVITALVYSGAVLAGPEPGEFRQVRINSTTKYRGWSNSVSGVMAEMWNYIVYGHGRRSERPVYGLVPGDFNPIDEGTDNGTDNGTDDGVDNGTDNGTDDGVDNGTDDGSDNGSGTDDGSDNGSGTDDGSDDRTDKGYDPGDYTDPGVDPVYNPDPVSPPTAPVPEPGTLVALLAGAAGTYLCRRRRKKD